MDALYEHGKEFVALQEERVRTYGQLEQAHRRYLNTAPDYDFSAYKNEVAKATEAFSHISNRILTLQNTVDTVSTELASCIEQVQKLEQEKLALTVEYQLAVQNLQDNDTDNDTEQSQGLRRQLQQLKDKISDQMEEVRYILADIKNDDEAER